MRDCCVDWMIDWVACWIAFMSMFFSFWKTGFKKWFDISSIPSRHLAIYWASQAFSYRNPDTSLTLGGSIEKALASSIAFRHLVDRSSFCSWIWWSCCLILARYLSCRQVFFSTPTSIAFSTPHLSSFRSGWFS